MDVSVAVAMIGIGDWEKYTLPALNSLYRQEPSATVLCLDNGSEPPYPERRDVAVAIQTVSYPAAINLSMALLGNGFDWYVVINNDVLFEKPIFERIAGLDPDCIYGFWTHKVCGRPYLSSWCMFISRKVWEKVGQFDEAFQPMWYEDADYCIRADALGFRLIEQERTSWGIHHFAPDRKEVRTDYMAKHNSAMKRNLEYLAEKHDL